MATYNGARFVADQITSIVNQTNDEWRLIIRDDGSTDTTPAILAIMAAQHPDAITVLQDDEKNLGVIGNFSRLLETAPYDYTMLSDQDDVWLLDKIDITIARMRELEQRYGTATPILVHTDLKVVNDTMEVVADSFWRYQLLDPCITSLNRLLIQNHITGCTMIINRALRELSLPISNGVLMHDWWIALVAAAFGVIDSVPSATMLYRQHGGNVEGAKEWNLWRQIKGMMKGFIQAGNDKGAGKAVLLRTQRQAGIFLDRYKDQLNKGTKAMVEAYATLDGMGCVVKRLYLLRYRFFQEGFWRNVALFFKI